MLQTSSHKLSAVCYLASLSILFACSANVSMMLQTLYRPTRCFDAVRSEDQIPMGAGFCALVQNGPGPIQPPIQWVLDHFRGEVDRCVA